MTDAQEITYTEIIGDPADRETDLSVAFSATLGMYDGFVPKGQVQGLPPTGNEERRAWVKQLFETGEHFLAWREGKVIGHCCLILDPRHEDAEYLIFVHQDFWRRGIGTELTRRVIDRARQLGLKSVWLTVEALNFRAIRLYRRVGFLFCDAGERERTMILNLRDE